MKSSKGGLTGQGRKEGLLDGKTAQQKRRGGLGGRRLNNKGLQAEEAQNGGSGD